VIETVVGAATLIAAVVLWRRRKSLARRELPTPAAGSKSAFVLGLSVGAVELPTAFPYFAVIAAIVGSGYGPVRQLGLLALYNLAFLLPLILMILTFVIVPDHAAKLLQRARDWLQRRWPTVLASLALLAGLFVTTLGVTGLLSGNHGPVGTISRRVRRSITR
jgi:cytochrome c biogenesis protein CcdA